MASSNVNHRWKATTLNSIEEILDTLAHLRVHRWITRGQSRCFGELFPKIDRDPLDKIVDRTKKIKIECQSIELFRSTARFFASPDEQDAMRTDISTLMVLQHYGVPTRLLDWTQSPYVAVYFSICKDESDDGELWSFDYDRYIEKGNEQWKNYPGTKIDAPIEERYATALAKKEPDPDFFMCVFYYLSFHREKAQEGVLSMTAKFGQDHAESISKLLEDDNFYHLYVIKSELKPNLQKVLRADYGIWSGTLFPDTAGAAETVKETLLRNA